MGFHVESCSSGLIFFTLAAPRQQLAKACSVRYFSACLSKLVYLYSRPVAANYVEQLFRPDDNPLETWTRRCRYLEPHPNIVSLEDLLVNEHQDELYIVMELLDCDLHYVINKSNQPLDDVHHRYFMFQILKGVKVRLVGWVRVGVRVRVRVRVRPGHPSSCSPRFAAAVAVRGCRGGFAHLGGLPV